MFDQHIYFPSHLPAIDCGESPDIPKTSKNGDGTTFGSTVTYSCDQGYEVGSGSNTSTCDGSKQWFPNTFTCIGKNKVNIYNMPY